MGLRVTSVLPGIVISPLPTLPGVSLPRGADMGTRIPFFFPKLGIQLLNGRPWPNWMWESILRFLTVALVVLLIITTRKPPTFSSGPGFCNKLRNLFKCQCR